MAAFSEFLTLVNLIKKRGVNKNLKKISAGVSEEKNTYIDEFPEPIKSVAMTIAEQLYRKGVKEGKEQGVQEGLEKGMQLGIEKAQFEIIVKSFENGASIDFISNITGLPESKIKEILNLR